MHLRSDSDKALLLGDLHRRFGLRVPDAHSGRRAHWNPRVARDLGAGRCVALLNARSLMQCYLYVACVEGIGEVSALVDRQVRDGHFYPRVILAHFCFDARVYRGTVLEAELIQLSSGQHVLAVADARAVCGISFADGSPDVADLACRQAAVGELLARNFRPSLATDICAIRLKPRLKAADLRTLVDSMLSSFSLDAPLQAVDYDIVAIVFKPTRGGHSPDADLHVSIPPPAGTNAGRRGGVQPAVVDDGEYEEDVEYDEEEDGDGDDIAAVTEPEIARTFHVRTTHLPDCYELHDTAEDASASVGCGTSGLLAGVPSLDASRYLQSVGNGKAQFVMSTKFGKWVPVIPSL